VLIKIIKIRKSKNKSLQLKVRLHEATTLSTLLFAIALAMTAIQMKNLDASHQKRGRESSVYLGERRQPRTTTTTTTV